MRVLPVRNINSIKSTAKNKINDVRGKVPRKVTLDNLPVVAGAVGFLIPIPLSSPLFYGIGKCVQYVSRKFYKKDK